MSTFTDLAVIDLHPGHDPRPVLAAFREWGDDLRAWIDSLPDRRSRLLVCVEMGAAHSLIESVFEMAGEHIARILVESNGDEFGAEHVVLANRGGSLVRTHHISVQPRDENGIPDGTIDLIINPASRPPDMFDHLPADMPARVRANPAAVFDYPELRHLLRSSGTYGEFPVDEDLTCESDDLDALLDGSQARARTAELYGVSPAAMEEVAAMRDEARVELCSIPAFSSWWRALGVRAFTGRGEPDVMIGSGLVDDSMLDIS